MRQQDGRLLILIVIIAAFSAWVSWPNNPGINVRIGEFLVERNIDVQLGLDLQGGMQVLLEADVPEDEEVDPAAMEAVRGIIENRVDGLGVAEPVVQAVGARRVVVEMPGIQDPERAIETLKETGLLEFIDTGTVALPAGTVVQTTMGGPALGQEPPDSDAVYRTVLTGRNLRGAAVNFDPGTGAPSIAFEFDSEGGAIFGAHTAANVGRYMSIVLDKVIISSPQITTAIPEGRGQISGNFGLEEARSIVLQLRYGALPIPLRVLDTRAVGPTLGAESVEKSTRAGFIGLIVVLTFMLVYYRLPGLLACIALIIYALITLATYKLIPVTLTLPGIAGFLLSVGMAVDANILIFERMREELRQGRTLQRSVEYGFRRAWSSILDSNISVWITCVILWWFGNSFGASMVKGFAVTLALGVATSMFTAITVTRTFVHIAFDLAGDRLRERRWLLGI